MLVQSLSELECIKVLTGARLGRLACTNNGQPYVVPIYFAYAEKRLYAFSMPGKKIEWMRANPLVSILVEEHRQGREWRSVIVDGRYEELPDRVGYKVQRDHAWGLLSKHVDWWEPGALVPVTAPVADNPDYVFFCVAVDQLSGREAKEASS